MRAATLVVIILTACTLAAGSQARKHLPPPPSHKFPPPLSAQEVFKRVSPSVVVMESLDTKGSVIDFGSGVVIALGDVITNRHVIEGGISFRVEHNGEKFSAKLIAVDPDHDLAVLSVAGLDVVGLQVRNSSTLAVGEKVYAVGAPEGLELTISEGLISGLRDFDNGRVIQTSAAISPGSSGGGLFDAYGRLVGITTFYLKEGQNLNFALPAEWIASLPERAIAKAQAAADTPIDVLEVVALEQIMREWPAISHPGPIDLFDLVWLEQKLEQESEWQGLLKLSLAMTRWYPRDNSAWDRLAEAYRNLEQYRRALEADRKAVEISPEDAVAWRNLGLDYGGLQQYEKAAGA